MKIALVDDDRACLSKMQTLCARFGASVGCPIETIPFESGEAFLAVFARGRFDLVFLDVYMDGIDGLAAAGQVRAQDSSCLLVFLTSSREFMPDAFSFHAFEYVAKPFSRERIQSVLADALKVLPQEQKYVDLAADRKPVRLFLDQIAAVVTDAHYLDITLLNGETLRPRLTMPEFLAKTNDDPRFLLVNKGIAVNVEHILSFEKGCCVMENGLSFPVRVRSAAKIEQMARDYHFQKMRSRQLLPGAIGAPAAPAGPVASAPAPKEGE